MTDRDQISFPPSSDDDDGTATDEAVESVVTTTDGTDSSKASDVLAAIADPDCRTILAASAQEPLSVADVVEQCDIPTATAYRKVNMLVDAGLLHERIQIRPYGRNEHEYSLRIETVHVRLTPSGPPEATVTVADDGANTLSGQALTDGGQVPPDESESSSTRELGSIFVDITGTEELVDEQERNRPDKQLANDDERSVSEYVSATVRDDGLSDSLPEPDGQSQG